MERTDGQGAVQALSGLFAGERELFRAGGMLAMGFIGRNGAGKSTTLKALLGVHPDAGEVTVLGKSFREMSNHILKSASAWCWAASTSIPRRRYGSSRT